MTISKSDKIIVFSLVTAIIVIALIYYSSFITKKKQLEQLESVKAGFELVMQYQNAQRKNAWQYIFPFVYYYNNMEKAKAESIVMIKQMTGSYQASYTINEPLEE